jgi:hypothetical protein
MNLDNIITYSKDLHQKLLYDLEQRPSGDTEEWLYEKKIDLINAAIDDLKQHTTSTPFVDNLEEIEFMKNLLPAFLALLVYYSEQADLESTQLIASQKLRLELIARKLDKIDFFFMENAEFIRYYHSGNRELDHYYFLRANATKHYRRGLQSKFADLSFYPNYSYKVAELIAYSRLEGEIQQLKANKWEKMPGSSGTSSTKLEWTDSKTGLVELIYSLKEQGAFNNGKVDLKTIADHFERSFSVSLGNTSAVFQRILYRKTGRTQYIDQLKGKLIERIDEIEDEHGK